MTARKAIFCSLILVMVLMGWINKPVLAQTPETPIYRLNINRDFGYGNGADIKGKFSLSIAGPDDYVSVSYYIDGQLMATLTEKPFKFQFNTGQYPYGKHELTAEVTSASGSTFTTPARNMNFVTAKEESTGLTTVVVPFFILIIGVWIVVSLVQFSVTRKRNPEGIPQGTQRNYGYAGGSICRHCGRPTPRHIWGFNIAIGKFDRCENCGKWSVMQAAPIDILRAVEVAEKSQKSDQPTYNEKTDEDKLRELIDKSKYE